ncbi:tRNA 2-selenouridine(34) synthase MnmH [Aliterella atlantica]|uniref:tRNA 2-selenouridine synthase n=1 Tax=Aliterella atlantica CENA595 TaxID=1618023 RepID=A0A0D8ZVF1_9CYAN|nr:tRNA 2-selenouridine(34) synthase MnmH [Aliterella atlantica]KJH72449.1 tRNA 2-selenouridine synthase [Aliterella atlantica CENA595]
MPPSPSYTQQPWTETYSEIIDVRSQCEFAEDCIPGAINLPVLNDAERALVGTIYKQSPFTARKKGAALVAKNISQHLSDRFESKDKNYRPLVYCWRGGQRSNSMALVLAQIGWQVTVLEGGYKTYRAYVRQQLEELPAQFTYKLLCGLTGSGKTHILRQLSRQNHQVLDLEALANHRGSLLGEEWAGKPTAQPSQKLFESLLLQQLQSFEPSQPVWVESESNKIGQLHLPPSLWQQMKQATCIELQLPIAARVQFLLQEYPHLVDNPDILKAKLQLLKSRYGKEKIQQWEQLIDSQQWQQFVRDLLQHHYDPSYRQSIERDFKNTRQILSMVDLSPDSIASLLNSLVATLSVS